MIVNVEGDLLEIQKKLHLDYICHQVNCQGAMNSGIAKQIRETYPQVYEAYLNKYSETEDLLLSQNWFEQGGPSVSEVLLGQIQIIGIDNNHNIINMFSQENYGYNGKRYTSYDAFWNCLNEIKQQIPEGALLGFPYGIGCVRGGANWQVILKMIETVFENHYVYIVKLEDK